MNQSIVSEDFYMLCRDIGLERPTMLQQKSMDFHTRFVKKSMIIEALPRDGTLAAGLIPIIAAKRSRHKHKQADKSTPTYLMLVGHENLQQVKDMVDGLPRKPGNRSCAVIGLNRNARDDISELSNPAQVLISTPERIIDHIRRDNLTLAQVTSVTIIRPEGQLDSDSIHSFDQDVLFISSKISGSAPYHLYTDSPQDLGELKTLIKYPKVITRSEWYTPNRTAEWLEYEQLELSILTDFLYAWGIQKSVILCAEHQQRDAIARMAAAASVPLRLEVLSLRDSLLPLLEDPAPLVVYGLHESLRFHTLLDEALHSPSISSLYIFLTPDQRYILEVIQEKCFMKQSKKLHPSQEEVLRGKIKTLAEQVKLDKHPEELASMKKIMRRCVPFHLRSYLFAYLLRDAVGGISNEGSEVSNEHMVTLFVSIGKSKKVYPKDLVKLFTSTLPLKEDDIGSVRVLDNYSFVNISQDYAKQAVETMDSIKFRGRNITVNFAKKKTG